jgi:hypothetical protein
VLRHHFLELFIGDFESIDHELIKMNLMLRRTVLESETVASHFEFSNWDGNHILFQITERGSTF